MSAALVSFFFARLDAFEAQLKSLLGGQVSGGREVSAVKVLCFGCNIVSCSPLSSKPV